MTGKIKNQVLVNRWAECRGCLAFDEGICGLNIFLEVDIKDCPCAKCVVKVMCRAQCKKLLDYMSWRKVDSNYIKRMINNSRRSLSNVKEKI